MIYKGGYSPVNGAISVGDLSRNADIIVDRQGDITNITNKENTSIGFEAAARLLTDHSEISDQKVRPYSKKGRARYQNPRIPRGVSNRDLAFMAKITATQEAPQ